jgi:hypothetical protein
MQTSADLVIQMLNPRQKNQTQLFQKPQKKKKKKKKKKGNDRPVQNWRNFPSVVRCHPSDYHRKVDYHCGQQEEPFDPCLALQEEPP